MTKNELRPSDYALYKNNGNIQVIQINNITDISKIMSVNIPVYKNIGYTGLGILLAQARDIMHVLNKLDISDIIPYNGFIDIDLVNEGVPMKTENWFDFVKNTSYDTKICGCIVSEQHGKIGRQGICPEVLLLDPDTLLRCEHVFYTTRGDYRDWIDYEKDMESENPKTLPLTLLTENIISCIGSKIRLNTYFKIDQPLQSMFNNQAPYYKII